jgi:hypothetical protein
MYVRESGRSHNTLLSRRPPGRPRRVLRASNYTFLARGAPRGRAGSPLKHQSMMSLQREELRGFVNSGPFHQQAIAISLSIFGQTSRIQGSLNVLPRRWRLRVQGGAFDKALAFLSYSPALCSDTCFPLSVQEQSCAADLLHHVEAPI